jgi:hypothetical protein
MFLKRRSVLNTSNFDLICISQAKFLAMPLDGTLLQSLGCTDWIAGYLVKKVDGCGHFEA